VNVRLGTSVPSALALALLGAAALDAAPAAPAAGSLELLARQMESAVSRVSGSAQALTGAADRTRALHVGGLGFVIVLPPRALPPQHRPLSVRSRARDQQAADPAATTAAAPPAVRPPVAATPRGVDQLQRELEHEMAIQALLMQAIARAQQGDDALLRRVLQLQMLAIQEQAEAFRVGMERARARAEQDVLVQLRNQRAADAAPAAPGAADAPATPAGPAPPPEPPWRAWLGAPPEAAQLNQALVDQVQEAMVSTLEAHGDEVRALGPQESVTVAVDFVGAGPFGLRPRVKSTLVVRAGAADVQARAAGRLSGADFRQRVQVRQY
jgi:hypothetical protein